MPRKSKGDRVVVFGRVSPKQKLALQVIALELGIQRASVSELIELISQAEVSEVGGRKILVLPVDSESASRYS